ncbi:MAG: dihydrodipicolinate synthase family protein [Deltaproteobacteria bacterium]|nr:MAG: dihydrodipicolinate synthase family protein [Deltaproteobacteria bacterium]
MMAEGLPKGLIVDLITPLNDKGGIDSQGLDTLLKKILPYADAILLAGPQMGEGRGLGLKLKIDLLEKAATFIQGKVPIFFWISEDSVKGTRDVIAHLEALLESSSYNGAVFWLDSPLFYHSNRGLYNHYQDLTLNTGYPFVLYNDPGLIRLLDRPLKRGNIRTNILKDLGKIDKIKALIFRGSLTRANNYQRALNTRADLRVYDGDEVGFLEHPSLSGVLSIGANIAPGIWSKVTRASLGMLKEDRERPDYLNQIWEMGKLLRDLIQIYSRNPVWIIKKALFDLKIIGSPACTNVTEGFQEKDSVLADFISRHNIV